MNGLSHLTDTSCKAEFACALMRGLGGNLGPQTREKFAKEVRYYILTQEMMVENHVLRSLYISREYHTLKQGS